MHDIDAPAIQARVDEILNRWPAIGLAAVSYTHLTLPTIYSV